MKPAEPSLKQDKRQAIIDAASKAFLENGYQNTSMETISCEAGVAKQTLYNYFGNKDALFVAVIDQKCDLNSNSFLLTNEITPENLEAVLQRYATNKLLDLVSKENVALYRTIIAEAIRFPNLGKLFFQNSIEEDRLLLAAFFLKQKQAGYLEVDDPELAALFFQGALNSYFRSKLIMADDLPSKQEIQTYINYCIQQFLALHQKKV